LCERGNQPRKAEAEAEKKKVRGREGKKKESLKRKTKQSAELLAPMPTRKRAPTRQKQQSSCTIRASSIKLVPIHTDTIMVDKKGKRALLCKSASHKSLACKILGTSFACR